MGGMWECWYASSQVEANISRTCHTWGLGYLLEFAGGVSAEAGRFLGTVRSGSQTIWPGISPSRDAEATEGFRQEQRSADWEADSLIEQ